ncbi:MAG TPA: bifunctional diguanylate cyclase/phosphodiesterase, partial [Geminicoccaceae bacterium]|nr:bifunctional diguanylate cyclase/phosphodiesterase [Geminicoccaceae bacterium]
DYAHKSASGIDGRGWSDQKRPQPEAAATSQGVAVNRDRNGPGWTEPPTPAFPLLPMAPTRSGLGDPTVEHGGGGPPASLARSFWAAPLVAALLAGILLLAAFGTGWLHVGPTGTDALLAGFSLGVLAASVAQGVWQHQVAVRRLRWLADGVGGLGTAAGLPTPRELAPHDACLAPQRAPTAPERDRLTALLTASGLREVAERELEAARSASVRLVLLVVDIARLGDVNGSHGYAVGDEILRQVGRRLAAACPSPPVAARIGGDRFALLVPLEQAKEGLRAWPAAVTAALGRPFRVAGCELTLTVHAGAAVFPDHAASFHHLMRAAELALEAARRGDGRHWYLFEPRMNQAAAAHKALERELRQAIEANGLTLHYQPQVDLATGRVIGVEALLRWPHAEKGFIPVAEASGLIRPLGAWVLAQACGAARRWRDQELEISVSVNVSAAQLRRQDLVGLVGNVLRTTGLPPDVLELELTESMFVDPTQLAMHRAIQGIAGMGVRLAIDDFGTGYSSLGYLKRLPVHKIKIDKSFVRELGRDEADAAIVRSIIGLARTFGKRVLAEGVEELNQFQFLLGEGCHEAQGYYFAWPMPESACTAFLLRHATAARPATAAPVRLRAV